MNKRAPTEYPRRTQQQWLLAMEQACTRFAEGHSLQTITETLHVSYEAVRVWRHKWQQHCVEAAIKKWVNEDWPRIKKGLKSTARP